VPPLISTETVREAFGISPATLHNWIKTSLIPAPDTDRAYSRQTFDAILHTIRNGTDKLSARANRSLAGETRVSYPGIQDKSRKALLGSLIRAFAESGLSAAAGVWALSEAMLGFNGLLEEDWRTGPKTRMAGLLSAWLAESGEPEPPRNPFAGFDLPCRDDDLIGAFYQSVQSVASRSRLGAYYTPSALLAEIKIPAGKTVYDPCCGSGGILLGILDKNHDPALVFASDIDATALNICAVNLALFFNDRSAAPHIRRKDIVFENPAGSAPASARAGYDYIVTNPPWGSKFTRQQKKDIARRYPDLGTTETFSIALGNCLELLKPGGSLCFFLPQAFLTVAAHKNIRQKLLAARGNISLRLLGSVFRGVMSESVLLRFTACGEPLNTISITGKYGGVYSLRRGSVGAPDFIINAGADSADAAILEKIYALPHTTLGEGVSFGLGIVTGGNRRHIQSAKTPRNEAVYRGKDIFPCRFAPPECFIEFNPRIVQQAARTELYRQRKIAYRFISDRLICALDETGSLLLNSANLLVSHNYPMETIVCLFNSPVYTYIFQKKFHSKKVLQSHLRNLPLPFLSGAQHALCARICAGLSARRVSPVSARAEIDRMLAGLFHLSDDEYTMILNRTNAGPF
jgi:tRNA1(Val) A37 N6-methylase TrmN6